MSIPITDVISGSPAGAAPAIRTLAKGQHRKNIRARTVVIVPAGAAPPAHCALFVAKHELRANPDPNSSIWDWDIGYPERNVDVYRSRRLNEIAECGHNCGWTRSEGITELAEVHPLERQWLRDRYAEAERVRKSPERRKAQEEINRQFEEEGIDECVRQTPVEHIAPFWLHEILEDEDKLDDYIRRRRGDLSTLGWWDSPWTMTRDQAGDAGILRLCTEHLYCGVREEHGRWQYYRGLGGHLAIEGTADTRAEAEMMARAHLFRAWLERVKEIEAARGGDLSWGWPVPSPNWQEVGDPQENY